MSDVTLRNFRKMSPVIHPHEKEHAANFQIYSRILEVLTTHPAPARKFWSPLRPEAWVFPVRPFISVKISAASSPVSTSVATSGVAHAKNGESNARAQLTWSKVNANKAGSKSSTAAQVDSCKSSATRSLTAPHGPHAVRVSISVAAPIFPGKFCCRCYLTEFQRDLPLAMRMIRFLLAAVLVDKPYCTVE